MRLKPSATFGLPVRTFLKSSICQKPALSNKSCGFSPVATTNAEKKALIGEAVDWKRSSTGVCILLARESHQWPQAGRIRKKCREGSKSSGCDASAHHTSSSNLLVGCLLIYEDAVALVSMINRRQLQGRAVGRPTTHFILCIQRMKTQAVVITSLARRMHIVR